MTPTPDGQELLTRFMQTMETGGANTPPELRLLMFALAISIRAKDILELGIDRGFTTTALAMTGARVVGVDNFTDHPGRGKQDVLDQLARIPNVLAVDQDTLEFLARTPDDSFDMIFVDDTHKPEHVGAEAKHIRRILRPGGIAVFHDTNHPADNRRIVDTVFVDWHRLHLPSISTYREQHGEDFGASIVRRPG